MLVCFYPALKLVYIKQNLLILGCRLSTYVLILTLSFSSYSNNVKLYLTVILSGFTIKNIINIIITGYYKVR